MTIRDHIFHAKGILGKCIHYWGPKNYYSQYQI